MTVFMSQQIRISLDKYDEKKDLVLYDVIILSS